MTLLDQIREISLEAASKLKRLKYCSDSEIRTLTQYDLQELLPGLENFRVRKKIYETIHKKRPIHVVLNELKSFIPDEFLQDALSSNGALNEYLEMLKTLKVEINHVQEFLDAQIDLLEKYGLNQVTKSKPETEITDRPSVTSMSNASAANSASSSAIKAHHTELLDHFKSQNSPNTIPNQTEQWFSSLKAITPSFLKFETHGNQQVQATVTYKIVVSGNTLQRHLDVMETLKNYGRGSINLQEAKFHEDVIIVFCPIVSRVGTDVDLALQNVSGTKPIILVMMHHSRTAQTSPIVKPSYHNVVLVVNVYFHETVPGLLKCPQNDEAIVSIQAKLQTLSS